jgi:hypothetical protein
MSKYLLILSFLLISCGETETIFVAMEGGSEADAQVFQPIKNVILPVERSTLTWKVKTNCKKAGGTPIVKFFDKWSGETYGPYVIDHNKYITLDCIKGNRVCWGAWMGDGPYYDCSQADETGYCYYVEWNEEYRIWGCGPKCTKGIPSCYCPYCYSEAPLKNIFISCGDIYNE